MAVDWLMIIMSVHLMTHLASITPAIPLPRTHARTHTHTHTSTFKTSVRRHSFLNLVIFCHNH